MNKNQKELVVADVNSLISSSQATFLVEYKGMSAASLRNLRKVLRVDGGTFKVVKATLMRRAVVDIAGSDDFKNHFKNQVGLVFAKSNVSGVAKSLVAFEKDNNNLPVIVAGFYESQSLSLDQVKFIASLPSKEVIIAQLLGTMQAPIMQFARVLHAMIAQLLYVLKRIEEKKNSQ